MRSKIFNENVLFYIVYFEILHCTAQECLLHIEGTKQRCFQTLGLRKEKGRGDLLAVIQEGGESVLLRDMVYCFWSFFTYSATLFLIIFYMVHVFTEIPFFSNPLPRLEIQVHPSLTLLMTSYSGKMSETPATFENPRTSPLSHLLLIFIGAKTWEKFQALSTI